MHGKATGRQKT